MENNIDDRCLFAFAKQSKSLYECNELSLYLQREHIVATQTPKPNEIWDIVGKLQTAIRALKITGEK